MTLEVKDPKILWAISKFQEMKDNKFFGDVNFRLKGGEITLMETKQSHHPPTEFHTT